MGGQRRFAAPGNEHSGEHCTNGRLWATIRALCRTYVPGAVAPATNLKTALPVAEILTAYGRRRSPLPDYAALADREVSRDDEPEALGNEGGIVDVDGLA